MAANQIPRRKANRPQIPPETVLALVALRTGVPESRILDFSDRMPEPVEARWVLAGLLYDCGGMSSGRIAAMLGTSRSVVSKWRCRWKSNGPAAHTYWLDQVRRVSRREVAA